MSAIRNPQSAIRNRKARLEMVRRVLPAWNIQPQQIAAHYYGENAVFKVRTTDGETLIARLSGVGLRTPDEVRAEIRFIEHCHVKEINVALPRRTMLNEEIALTPNLDASVDTREPRIVSLFEYIAGRRPTIRTINDKFLFRWGAFIAQMHTVTENYRQTGYVKRPVWHEVKFQSVLSDELNNITWARRAWHSGMEWLQSLPQEDFGLIHADAHENNLKIRNGEIYLFDFDDACVIWRVYDLAVGCMRFYNSLNQGRAREQRAALLAGYRSLRNLSADWEKRIDGLILVRELWGLNWLTMRRHVPFLQEIYPRVYARVEAQFQRTQMNFE